MPLEPGSPGPGPGSRFENTDEQKSGIRGVLSHRSSAQLKTVNDLQRRMFRLALQVADHARVTTGAGDDFQYLRIEEVLRKITDTPSDTATIPPDTRSYHVLHE